MDSWAREEALLILNKVIRQKAYSNIELRKALSRSNLNRLDRALVNEIVNGTLRYLITIDWIASQFIKMDRKKLSPIIEDTIRCGIYQIIFLDRIPHSAVCNECSELARKYSNEGAVKFVNGVLRNISRKKVEIQNSLKGDNIKNYSILYSYPDWIIKLWEKMYEDECVEDLLRAGNEIPKITIRTNTLLTNREALKKALKEDEVIVEEGRYLEEALNISHISSIEELRAYKEGYFYVQDESSMLVSDVLDAKPKETILDVCSAPGGKAFSIAQNMHNEGLIIARDIFSHKIKLIESNCNRLGIQNIKVEKFDATVLDETKIGMIDRVLVDAPCSGLGIIRKKPELKYNRKEKDLYELKKLQLKILDTCKQYVKKGGVLVYSTCTINKYENEEVVWNFLNNNSDFKLDSIEPFIPQKLKRRISNKSFIQLLPNIDEIDGFFIARMIRV